RIIRENEPPRLGALDRAFRGDIDTIVAKALEKDKIRRYQSAADLADDLRRHLSGEPIEAKRDSAMYVLRKQLQRYRGVAAAACVFVLLLAGFAAYAAWKAEENQRLADAARRAEHVAVGARDQARHSAERLSAELSSNRIEQGRLMSITGSLVQAEDL